MQCLKLSYKKLSFLYSKYFFSKLKLQSYISNFLLKVDVLFIQ